MITNKKESCVIVEQFEARIKIISLTENTPVMSSGFTCLIHLHTAKEEITIKKIKGKVNDKTGTL